MSVCIFGVDKRSSLSSLRNWPLISETLAGFDLLCCGGTVTWAEKVTNSMGDERHGACIHVLTQKSSQVIKRGGPPFLWHPFSEIVIVLAIFAHNRISLE